MSPTVAIVDDDASIRDALALLLSVHGIESRAFASAEEFLLSSDPASRGCILTDLRMPGASGLELLAELKERQLTLPVIMLTAHGDVASTRKALLGGAFDFLEKPVDDDLLLEVLRNAIAHDARAFERHQELDERRSRIDRLTPREREVLLGLGRGMQNREIAEWLSISPRTVEVYKARMMEKLACENLADVVRMSELVAPEP